MIVDDEEGFANFVGPTFQNGWLTEAIIETITTTHKKVVIFESANSTRVIMPDRCVIDARAVSKKIGRPFAIANELYPLLLASRGAFKTTPNCAIWTTQEK